MPKCLFALVKRCLDAAEPAEKAVLLEEARAAWRDGALTIGDAPPPEPIGPPGRPPRPRLVPPRCAPRRRLHTETGRAAFIHAIAHIEFNAINLALDAVYRFRGLPPAYYQDWLRVAAEESRHFNLLQQRLNELGYAYGDFDAHDGLWEMAIATAGDPLARLALGPRTLEARGLDVTPGMIERLDAVGDARTSAILAVILREEIGHVALGSRWFRYCCERAGLPVEDTFVALARRYYKGKIATPFNEAARLAAGFTRGELELLRELNSVSSGRPPPPRRESE